MNKILYRSVFVLLCTLVPALKSCTQSEKKEVLTEEQIGYWKEWNQTVLPLREMLNDREFEQALLYVDTLHMKYSNNPRLYFVEGWAHDMLGDSLRARIAYKRALALLDSLIAVKPNLDDMAERAMIIQLLYGKDAYEQTIDEMISTVKNENDSLKIESLRYFEIDKNYILF